MKKILFIALFVLTGAFVSLAGDIDPANWGAELTGLWKFDNAANRLEATVGTDLILQGGGSLTDGSGAFAGDGSVIVPLGSYLDATHGIANNMGNGGTGANYVNEYTIVWDILVPDLCCWYSLLQTNATNANDVDLAIQPGTGTVGIGTSGYSTVGVTPMTWERIIVRVDLGNFYEIYLNGELIVDGGAQPIDGRFALENDIVKFFADNDVDDQDIETTMVAVFDRPLTLEEIQTLSGVPTAPISCTADQTNVMSNVLSGTEVELSWTENANPNFWEIEYGPAGFTQGMGTLIATGSNPYTLSNLSPITSYEFYLRGNCGGAGNTNWVGPASFTTSGCVEPSGVAVPSIGAFTARVQWMGTAGFDVYDVEFGPTGFTLGTGAMASGLTNEFYTMTNLVEDTAYDVYVREDCNGSPSNWAGPVTFTTGPIDIEEPHGDALSFDGFDDYVDLGSSFPVSADLLALPTEALTVSAWININNFNDYAAVIGFMQDNGGFERGWQVHTRASGTLGLILATENEQILDYSQQVSVNAGEWIHIAATYDGTMARLYLNGTEALAYARTGLISYSDSWLVLGKYKDDNEEYFFDGLIDEVSIWGRALDQTEILDLLCKEADNPTDLISLYEMDGSDGIFLNDETGILNGTINGAILVPSLDVLEQCLPPDNVDTDFNAAEMASTSREDYINTTFDPAFGTDQDFSIDFRIRTDGWDGDPAIVSDKDWNSGNNAGFVIAFNNNSIKVNAGSGSNRADVNGTLAINDGEWHHVLATFDRDGQLELFLDEISQGTDQLGGDVGDMNSAYTMKIGQDGTGDYPAFWSSTGPTGDIAEVRVWNRVIGVDEVPVCTGVDANDPLFNDLLHYYKLDEGTGTLAADSKGMEDGTWVNNEAWTNQNNFPNAIANFTPNVILSTVAFNNLSSTGNYFWDFGDNNTSTAASPTHTYLSTGDFDVTLIVSSACDNDTLTQTITIQALDNNLLNSLDLDGSDDYVQFANTIGNQDFTVELLVKSEGWSSDPSIIANKDWGSGSNPGFIIAGNGNSLDWKINVGDGSDRIDMDGGVINDGVWHHIAFTYDADGMKKIFQDGALLDQDATVLGDISTNLDLAIGQDGTLTYGAFFNGQIAEVRIWDVPVADQTITDFICGIDNHPNLADLKHYWKADEGTGTLVADSEDTNDGTYNGDWTTDLNTLDGCEAPTPVNSIGSGNAVEFDGVNDWIDCSGGNGSKVSAASLGLPTEAITVECWVKVDQFNIWNAMVGFLQDNGNFERGWDIETRPNNKFAFTLKSENASSLTYMETGNSFETDKWYHVAGVYDGTTMSVYVDGMLEATSTSQSGLIDYADSWLAIGMYRDDNEQIPLNGTVDEVRIWDYARTLEEIRDDMCQKLDGMETGLVAYYRLDNLLGEDVRDWGPNMLNGEMTNMDAPTARITSGAPIGDESTQVYTNSWTGETLMLASAGFGDMTLSDIDGIVSGVHLYRVDNVPNTVTGIFDPGNTGAYYGTFLSRNSGATHSATYDYSTFPDATMSEDNLALYNRANNAITSWFYGGAQLDTNNDELLLTNIGSRREMILADFTGALCQPPFGLTAIESNFTDVLLGWSPASGEFNIEYGPAGFEFGTGILIEDIMEDTVRLEGLDAAIAYDVYIQDDCGGDGTSAWTGPFTVMTTDPCPAPTNFMLVGVTDNSATFSWDAPGTVEGFQIQWGTAGFTLGNGITTSVPSSPGTLNFLPGDTEFQAYLLSDCSNFGLESSWVGPIDFSTLPTNINEPEAEIAWMEVFPNPTEDLVNVQIISEKLENARLQVINLLGQSVMIQELPQQPSVQTQLDLGHLPKGTYMIVLTADNGQVVKRVLLQ